MNLNEYYHELAEKSLAKGKIDVEAYIVKVLSEMAMSDKQVASVQVSQTPKIEPKTILEVNSPTDYFKEYLRTKNKVDYDNFILQTEQILTEMYHSTTDQNSIDKFHNFVDRLQTICTCDNM